ncbi:hypothetical protein HMH01_02930 [Halovulum dunhuangense]|uniref:Lipopolysaccharide export system protein LptC n=1 Tax=Halovulum dunhuangense TaxID=1505036 RepID=A0A849KZN7_9RHOB|nr:hypothetical protein [Halovulum dunhuangense]NNU79384.1 hypothetical protein [Halovulum dunhuangense]
MAEGGPDRRARPSRRTRVVGWLKIVLPLVALALLGAVIFWRQQDDLGPGLRFTESDMEAMRSGLIVTGPRLSGVSLGGDQYDFRAAQVAPEDLSITRARVSALTGRVIYVDGRVVTLEAASADIDMGAGMIRFDDGLRVTTSEGYDASAPVARVDVAAARLTADGPVEVTGPAGRIEAGGMVIEPSDPDAARGDALMRFTGGVTLRYTPGEMGEGE